MRIELPGFRIGPGFATVASDDDYCILWPSKLRPTSIVETE